MKTILVPLDGSELAAQALPYAQALAHLFETRLYLMHVIGTSQRREFFRLHPEQAWTTNEAPLEGETSDERLHDGLTQHGVEYLRQMAASLVAAGLDVELDVHFGAPAGCILNATEKIEGDLIVMVTHGYSGLKRWTLGSVTDEVVRSTSTPLFIVRGQEQPATQPPAFKRVLLSLDGSDVSHQALPVATRLARTAAAELHLIQAIPPEFEFTSILTRTGAGNAQTGDVATSTEDEVRSEVHTRAESYLEKIALPLRREGMTVRTYIKDGYPSEMIIAQATLVHADVIVMATHGYSGFKRLALGSVADKVLRATTTPLLLVRASG
ncbi:MAG: universal stress protein [Chloroflexaceae bacterium]|nr:universal stress protein [Chloroflexaceae bacterium]NJO07702.1 universal stress protein [Chloroflexaceae bacterium]